MIRILALLWIARIGLALVGLRRMKAWAEPAIPQGSPWVELAVDRGSYVSRCVALTFGLAGEVPVRASCLHRSIALCRLLRSSGFDASLAIGVKKAPECFEAHAWVQLDGQALDPASCEYVSIRRFLANEA